MILGVCKKLERITGINVWIFRILFICFGFSFVGVVVYFGLYLFL